MTQFLPGAGKLCFLCAYPEGSGQVVCLKKNDQIYLKGKKILKNHTFKNKYI